MYFNTATILSDFNSFCRRETIAILFINTAVEEPCINLLKNKNIYHKRRHY